MHYLQKYGKVPLPPYISRPDFPDTQDQERYQTLYASDLGSIAAPTAGLHFSHALISELIKKNIKFVPLTLHIGLGTFQPLRENNIIKNQLHWEYYEIAEPHAQTMNQTLEVGGRLIIVGTTTARALESAVDSNGQIRSGKGETNLFIHPPYRFKIVKNLLTNFHLPKSSLLMLVAALMDREKMLSVYREAIDQQYRFYSYGDAMLILSEE
jgi:S-adenosylmethionine:tRNA ribosyltransferase-isomerase